MITNSSASTFSVRTVPAPSIAFFEILTGAISVALNSRLAIGGKLDYVAANYAKHRDMRHKNSLMDMNLSLGLTYSLTKKVSLGVNGYYRRSVEGLIQLWSALARFMVD